MRHEGHLSNIARRKRGGRKDGPELPSTFHLFLTAKENGSLFQSNIMLGVTSPVFTLTTKDIYGSSAVATNDSIS
jgi:hypothetical protein